MQAKSKRSWKETKCESARALASLRHFSHFIHLTPLPMFESIFFLSDFFCASESSILIDIIDGGFGAQRMSAGRTARNLSSSLACDLPLADAERVIRVRTREKNARACCRAQGDAGRPH
jgi:hypothetical protein